MFALDAVMCFHFGVVCLFNERRLAASVTLGALSNFLCLVILIAGSSSPLDICITSLWLVVGVSVISVFRCRRCKALQTASQAVKQDQVRYDEAWFPVKQRQAATLKRLAHVVSQHKGERKEQETGDMKLLYHYAKALNDWYQEVVFSWAKACNVEHSRAPVKTYRRALEKVYRSYSGRVPPLLDLVRSSVVVETIDQAIQVLELVFHNVKVHTIKNRFDLAYDGCATAGYRDLNLQISFPELDDSMFKGFVFELQMHLDCIIATKTHFGHKRYIALRNLRGDSRSRCS